MTKTFGREVVAWRIVTMGYMLLALMSISLVVSATKEKDRQFMESGVEPISSKIFCLCCGKTIRFRCSPLP